MASLWQSVLLRGALKRVLAFALSKAVGPLSYQDATTLLDIAEAGVAACQTRGVVCKHGSSGYVKGLAVCVPATWNRDDWLLHGCTCRHCPIFMQARKNL